MFKSDTTIGPTRVAAVGVVFTIFTNVIVCEFIYLNTSGIPDFQEIIWENTIRTCDTLKTPSIALIQETRYPSRAFLYDDSSDDYATRCQKESLRPSNQRCFSNVQHYNSDVWGPLNYVVFNANSYQSLNLSQDLDLLYAFTCKLPLTARHSPPCCERNGTDPDLALSPHCEIGALTLDSPLGRLIVGTNSNAIPDDGRRSQEPNLGIAVFDTVLMNELERALDCGIIPWNDFPARGRSALSLEQNIIDDKARALNNCISTSSYATYRSTITPLGREAPMGKCDVSTKGANKAQFERCVGDVDIYFTSKLVTTQTSKHKKNWQELLTDEGSIVGGITFTTWFLDKFISP